MLAQDRLGVAGAAFDQRGLDGVKKGGFPGARDAFEDDARHRLTISQLRCSATWRREWLWQGSAVAANMDR
jgi:hypothetical protein